MTEETKKTENPEEAEINAYMESPDGEGPTEKEQLQLLRKAYDETKQRYKLLQFQRGQAERMKNDTTLNQLTPAFRENFKIRKDCVIQLRRMGEKIKDRFVPEGVN